MNYRAVEDSEFKKFWNVEKDRNKDDGRHVVPETKVGKVVLNHSFEHFFVDRVVPS